MPKNKQLLPRFMVAENPMAEPDVEYVIHTQEPRFIAKRVYDNPGTDFEIVVEIDNMNVFFKGDALKMAGLMRRLGDWWVAYLKWEETQDYDDEDEE